MGIVNSTDRIYKYRIYCQTDNKWEHIWDTSAPTQCPVNTGHTVNLSSVNATCSIRNYGSINTTHSPFQMTNFNWLACHPGSGNITINLPEITNANKDRTIIIQKRSTSANTITVVPYNTQTIDSVSLKTITTNKQTLKIKSDGTSNWELLQVGSLEGEKNLDANIFNSQYADGQLLASNGVDFEPLEAAGSNYVLKGDSLKSTGLSWDTIPNVISKMYYKTSASTSTSTTLTDDPDLQFQARANSKIYIEGSVLATRLTTFSNDPNFSLAWTVPSGTSFRIAYTVYGSSSLTNAEVATSSGTPDSFSVISTGDTPYMFRGVLFIGNTSGTVAIQWAQSNASTDAVQVNDSSFIQVCYIG